MKRLFQHSFRNRIFATMLITVMLIVVFCNVLLLQLYIDRNNKHLVQQNQEQIERLQERIEKTFYSFEAIAKQLEDSSVTKAALRRGDSNSRFLYLNLYKYSEGWRDVAQFHIFNKNGVCEYTTNNMLLNQTMDTNWGPLYLASQSEQMVFVSQSDNSELFSPQNMQKGLVCAYAMHSRADKSIMGYLVITMEQDGFDELFQDIYDPSGLLYFLDSYWHLIYSSQPSQDEKSVAYLRTQFLSGTALNELDDGNHYEIYHIEHSGFYFVLQQSNAYSDTVLETNRMVMYQMCMIGLPICLLCALLLSRNFSKPVYLLDHAMKEIEGGNYDVKLEINRDDEFGRLAHGFNKMARQYKRNLSHQQELNRAQLRMLQAQLNPHFLYNTLDAIKWLGITHDVPIIAKLSTSLAMILRSSISSKELVTLEDELDLLEHYISIQSIRFADRFSYEIEIEPNCDDCIVPKLILQPLVENAILHGVIDCDEGYIKLSAYQENQCLILRVYDNGCGLPGNILEWLRSEDKPRLSNHMGLYNVNEIIQLQYGKAYGLSYVSGFSEGTCLQIKLPILKKENKETDSYVKGIDC